MRDGDFSAYLRAATVPPEMRTHVCATCRAPVSVGYTRCAKCARAPRRALPACAGFVVYAPDDSQTASDMYRYKGTPPSQQAMYGVAGMMRRAFRHIVCLERIVGVPVTALAVMPSRSHYRVGTSSRLQQIVESEAPSELERVAITPTMPELGKIREVQEHAFTSATARGHVLLIDDTWVSGGTMLSAVLSLRQAGAEEVSTLALARWLNPTFPATDTFVSTMDRVGAWIPIPLEKPCPFTVTGQCPLPQEEMGCA